MGIGRKPAYPLDVDGAIDAGALLASSQIGGVSWFGDADVYADGEGHLLRSTSSARYKREIETLDMAYSEAILAVRPIWYRSSVEADDTTFNWYRFLAEEVAAIDPRLIAFGDPDEAYEVVEIEDETGPWPECRPRH